MDGMAVALSEQTAGGLWVVAHGTLRIGPQMVANLRPMPDCTGCGKHPARCQCGVEPVEMRGYRT